VRYSRDAGPASLGARVVVRRRLQDGGLGDVVGVLEGWSDGVLTVVDRHGRAHAVREADVVAAKRVPPVPERRR
jgi:hypothetical protein